jgi:hypothetical protein
MPGYLASTVIDSDPRHAEIITAMLSAENPFAPMRSIVPEEMPYIAPQVTSEIARSPEQRDDEPGNLPDV